MGRRRNKLLRRPIIQKLQKFCTKRRHVRSDYLAPAHGWFTEGFVAPDLEEAKALLDGLA